MQKKLQLTVVCGHYGCGKTNLALNLALEAAQEGGQVTVVDMEYCKPLFPLLRIWRAAGKQGNPADSPGVCGHHAGYADSAAGDLFHL